MEKGKFKIGNHKFKIGDSVIYFGEVYEIAGTPNRDHYILKSKSGRFDYSVDESKLQLVPSPVDSGVYKGLKNWLSEG